jgi:hypothetical protein
MGVTYTTAAANTYVPIATTTLASAATSFTFSSIPSTYTDLVIIANGGISANGDTGLRFNGDTATNYSWTRMYGNGSATASDRATSVDSIGGASWYSATSNNTSILQIMNYSNATTYKTTISRSNATSTMVAAIAGLWRSTSAITSITMYGYTSSYSIGTTFSLYGILGA